MTRVFRLLDEGDAHLAAAGASFPFTLGPGYAGFNTPTNFRRLNRPLKARYKVHYAPAGVAADTNWTRALALLSGTQTFIDASAAGLTRAGLRVGPFHTFTTNTGDGTNGLSGTDYYLNTRIRDDAQLKTVGGARDDRVALKSRTVASFTFLEVTSNLKHADFTSTSLTSPTRAGGHQLPADHPERRT